MSVYIPKERPCWFHRILKISGTSKMHPNYPKYLVTVAKYQNDIPKEGRFCSLCWKLKTKLLSSNVENQIREDCKFEV